jgi:hypothetical protein
MSIGVIPPNGNCFYPSIHEVFLFEELYPCYVHIPNRPNFFYPHGSVTAVRLISACVAENSPVADICWMVSSSARLAIVLHASITEAVPSHYHKPGQYVLSVVVGSA